MVHIARLNGGFRSIKQAVLQQGHPAMVIRCVVKRLYGSRKRCCGKLEQRKQDVKFRLLNVNIS